MKLGKLIVLEGIDGSGKSTQTDLLLKYLSKRKIKNSYYKFPQYKKTYYGKLILDFLNGKFGTSSQVPSELISLAYSLDRVEVKDKINQELSEGTIVVIDRYVGSSKAHQASRVEKNKVKQFLNWLDNYEYKVNKVPREDLVILLDIPIEQSFKLMSLRKKDLMEQQDLQETSRQIYLDLSRANKHWVVINCVDLEGKLKSKEKIHQEILQILELN